MDASAPAILQIFDASYGNLEHRAADIFAAGYGGVWIPPTGRADSGNFSVGYDVYNRFDLGGPGAPTLYGTETGLKTLVDVLHAADVDVFADFVVNHNGFRDPSTPGFIDEGGYPGFALTLNPGNNSQGYDEIDGDFHSVFQGGDLNGRLAGLIDIAHDRNFQFIRQPVDAADTRNIPGGPIANSADSANARFYPDTDLDPIFVFDPKTGESGIPIYPYNLADPDAGDAVTENALGYLMRNARWLIETIGVDGLRVDAAKHVEPFVLEFLDRAVYRAIDEPYLDGSRKDPFLFLEIFSGDHGQIQALIRKDINPADPGRIGGNRDALDFPLAIALHDNLTGNGFVNDWRSLKNASQDVQDDGLANNGSQGVAFVNSHDEFGPYLSNVAHAYVLMRPGNAIVYMDAKEFGDGRDFPKDGRGDSLGGLYGDAITTLVDLRNTHGRGDYLDRTPVADEKEMLVFERSASALVVLSNRVDAGFDSRTIQTNFLPGTPLVELTGNAADPTIDPFNDFPEVLVVKPDGTVDLRVPRNVAPNGAVHNNGYFIYGPAGPQASMSLTDVAMTLGADTPTAATNGTARLSTIDVITADRFDVQLNTAAVNLLGAIRDQFADGDNALLKIDAGVDLNGNGSVDFTDRGGPSEGFEAFVTFKQPGFFEADGNGVYRQTIDATALNEGLHFLETRAFRHREPGEGDAIYSSQKQTIYIDRLPPESRVASFDPQVDGINENRRLLVETVDQTGDNVHVFWNLPAALSDAQVLSMVGGSSQSNRLDRDLFAMDVGGVTSGNQVATVVTYEITGNVNVQRFPGLFVSSILGAGLGDLDHDGDVDPNDISLFQTIYNSANQQFNPASDFNADGLVDVKDLPLFYERLVTSGNVGATFDAFDQFVVDDAPVDFGDAPDSYRTLFASNGPHHIVMVGPFFGTSVDTDPDGQPHPQSLGDDGDEVDDENGLISFTDLVPLQTSTLTVSVSADAKLDAWIDFNGNGVFDHPSEHLNLGTSIDVTAGSNSIEVVTPADAVDGETVLRLRISSLGNLSPLGLAGDGEVEDHQLAILPRPTVESVVINDGDVQRSKLTSIDVIFDRIVDAPAEAFAVTDRSNGNPVSALKVQSSQATSKTIARLTFGPGPLVVTRPSGNSLIDGNYRLTIDGAKIVDLEHATVMAENLVFGDQATDDFFRRFGDSDGDRDVDAQDQGRFGLSFLKSSGHVDFVDELDGDGDGDVDGVDFGMFRRNLGRRLPF